VGWIPEKMIFGGESFEQADWLRLDDNDELFLEESRLH
jgi:hypothetical protein